MGGCSRGIVDEPSPTPIEVVTTPPAALPVAGGELTIPIPEGRLGKNPLIERSREMNSFYRLIYESLVGTDDKGKPEPGLAQSWQIDKDALTLTLVLRKGVVWQNEDSLTADDIVATLDSIKEAGATSPYAEVLNYATLWQKDEEGNVVLTLKSAYYGVLHALDFPIVPKGLYPSLQSESVQPMGTGPYMVNQAMVNGRMVLEINPKWWRKAPLIPKVNVQVYANNSTALGSLGLRQLDAVQTSVITTSQYTAGGDVHAYEYTTRFFEFLAPNLKKDNILHDKRVRQAIAYALDRREIVSNVYVDHAILTDTPIPPISWLYEGKILTYTHNVEKARALIKEALGDPAMLNGVIVPWKVTLLTNEDAEEPMHREAAMLIKQQLEALNIEVTVEAKPWADFTTAVTAGEYDLLLSSWYLSKVPDFSFVLRSDGIENRSGYQDTAMDSLLDSALAQDTPEGLQNTTNQIQQKIIEDLPIISLYFRTHSLMAGNQVLGIQSGAQSVEEENAYRTLSSWYIDKGQIQ